MSTTMSVVRAARLCEPTTCNITTACLCACVHVHACAACACRFCIVTMTTVGYGDATPVTIAGQITAMLLMLFSLIVRIYM